MAMEWALSTPTTSPAKKKAKKEGGELEEDDDEDMVKTKGFAMSKAITRDHVALTLRTARGLAVIEGQLYKTWKVKTVCPVIEPALEAGKAYAESTKGKKNHGKGSPHIHVCAAVLKVLLTQNMVDQGRVQRFISDNGEPKKLAKAVPVFYVTKMCDEAWSRIVWHSPMDDRGYSCLDNELPKLLMATGNDGAELPGTAPRNPLERRLKKFLEKTKKKNGDKEEDDV